MAMMDFTGKLVHVIGLGPLGTGRAVARALAARGAKVTVSDSKAAEALQAEIEALEGTGVTILTGVLPEANHINGATRFLGASGLLAATAILGLANELA